MALPRSGLVCASIFVCSLSLFSQQTRIGGPDSLVYLGQRFAKEYGVKFSHAQFAVRGSSAASNPAELEILQGEGSAPKEKSVAFPIAVHAIVLYVNKANPIHELSVGQVRDIFRGRITNWKELGGPHRRINLFAGESTTGTLAFFEESVLHGEEPYPFEGRSSTHALLEVIAADPAAIG